MTLRASKIVPFESTIQWTDRETGLACKGRLDWLSSAPPVILDLKSLADAEMRALQQATARHDYHCQLAFYRAGLRANGIECESVKIVAVEQSEPYDVAVFGLLGGHGELGRQRLGVLRHDLQRREVQIGRAHV